MKGHRVVFIALSLLVAACAPGRAVSLDTTGSRDAAPPPDAPKKREIQASLDAMLPPDSMRAPVPDVTPPEPDAPTPWDSAPACPSFTMTVKEWSWSLVGPNVYSIATLLEVDGSEKCYLFPDYYKYTWLSLIWNEGVSLGIYRTADVAFSSWHSGFGPRSCSPSNNTCEVGDIFDTNNVYSGFPLNSKLNQLVVQYGVPDKACGHVYNANLMHKTHCAPLMPK